MSWSIEARPGPLIAHSKSRGQRECNESEPIFEFETREEFGALKAQKLVFLHQCTHGNTKKLFKPQFDTKNVALFPSPCD